MELKILFILLKPPHFAMGKCRKVEITGWGEADPPVSTRLQGRIPRDATTLLALEVHVRGPVPISPDREPSTAPAPLGHLRKHTPAHLNPGARAAFQRAQGALRGERNRGYGADVEPSQRRIPGNACADAGPLPARGFDPELAARTRGRRNEAAISNGKYPIARVAARTLLLQEQRTPRSTAAAVGNARGRPHSRGRKSNAKPRRSLGLVSDDRERSLETRIGRWQSRVGAINRIPGKKIPALSGFATCDNQEIITQILVWSSSKLPTAKDGLEASRNRLRKSIEPRLSGFKTTFMNRSLRLDQKPFRPSAAAYTLVILLLLASLFWADRPASAHGKSVSYSHWRLTEDGAEVSVRIALLELSRLQIPLPLPEAAGLQRKSEAVGRYLEKHLQLTTPGGPCQATGPPRSRPAKTGWVLYRWTLACPPDTERSLSSRLLLTQAPSHLHFARITLLPDPDSPRPRILERVLTEAEPRWDLGDGRASPENADSREATAGSSFTHYVKLGVEHILGGWDHLAFVLALILLARGLGEVARWVTGFTIAHSLTLALAVLGWVEPQTAPVEALIGFSVALIAIENAWLLAGRGAWIPAITVSGLLVSSFLAIWGIGVLPTLSLLGLAVFSAAHFGLLEKAADPSLHRIALAFAFGLIHGFGFAGVLSELALPPERLVPALFGFNIGVEIGQLGVVALLWPILYRLRAYGRGLPYRFFAEFASATTCALGLYWFITRGFGIG